MKIDDSMITRAIFALLSQRANDDSICPSDVARVLSADEALWRALMPDIRRVAACLAEADVLRITQGELTLPPNAIGSGPIRLRRGRLMR
ncbi:hypothetical protein PMM47T1_23712 [Pseudomonas sp. M47T1]|uniref:DUF3253 domain-containing protein n=1 Tax=unclassified Pseudomonas TaxID=196821 RepID=UPI0002607DD5|nr:DUF3253 domain-containing protein [Pseudomonas sp. M47T1]EIK94119.1 hypothetical protein PMM47T1_23712 [Pseudomonas sp. M47T1]